eukprot:561568_1
MSSYGLYGTVESKSNRTDSNLLVRDDDRFRTGTPFQDKLFAIVFLIWFILITILSLFFFVQNEDTFESHSQNRDNAYLNQYFWNLLLASIVISAVTSIVLLCIYHKYSQHLIWITFVSSCLLWLIYGMTLIISIGSIVLGLFVLFIALLELLWIYLNRDRIQFTTALLQLSIQGLNSCMSTYFISILGILFQIAWIIIWCMGFAYSIDGTQATKSTIVLYILAYYWIFQVISNIVLCTICGSVAMWYFFYPEHTPSHAVYNAFKRSVTRSFGSICYGSVVIAFVQTIRSVIYILYALIRETRRNHHRCAGCLTVCVSGLLRCMGGVIEYVDCYVFVRISVYGTDFCSSATETMELFRCKGFDMIINDDLTNSVVLLSCFMCSSVT